MKAYLLPFVPVGYGPRIFIPYEHHTLEVERTMKRLCVWGGYDKDTGKCYSYEFPNKDRSRFELAKTALTKVGFKLEPQSTENQAEVWK